MVSTENSASGERFAFSADIQKLMGLIINTFYTNKEVFLREVISNASDAIDKIKFQSLTDSKVLGDETEFRIEIIANSEAKTLTIRDNGIGMTRNDMIKNLGTIANSGTKSFMDAIQAGADIQMIGQFGVGFYSVFLVSDKVEVRSKHNDDHQHLWRSSADGQFDVLDDSANEHQLKRGTELILHLKDDQLSFLEERTLRETVKKHSEFVGPKVFLWVSKEVERELSDEEDEESKDAEKKEKDGEKDTGEKDSEEKDGEITEIKDEEAPKEKKKRKVTEIEEKWELVNSDKPILAKKPEDVTEEEYTAFYKSISNDWEEPLAHKHFRVEGQIEFSGIVFIPKCAPFDLFNSQKKSNNIKLFVRRVFINDDAKELCPEYLSFVKGAVNSEDMPLNISRETLQQNKIVKLIKKNIVKKTLELIAELQDDKEKFDTFYKAFSKNLKYGVHEDSANRKKLSELLRFTTSRGTEPRSLRQYVADMKEPQKDIYYITGESRDALSSLPFLELLHKKQLEVLYLTDPIDEYFAQQMTEFDGHKLVSATKEGLELPQSEEEKEALKKAKEELAPLCKRIKELLGARVERVEVSPRMTVSPVNVSTTKFGWSSRMEQIMKNQALRDSSYNQHMSAKKILEINPEHPIIKEMSKRLQEDTNDPVAKNLVFLIFDTALLTSGGFTLEKPSEYAERIYKMAKLGLNIVEEEPDEQVPELAEVADGAAAESTAMEEVD